MSDDDSEKVQSCDARTCCRLPIIWLFDGLRKFRNDPIAWFTFALVVVSVLQWSVLGSTDDAQHAIVRAYVFAKRYPRVNSTEAGQATNTAVGIKNGGQTPASNLVLKASLTKIPPANISSKFNDAAERVVTDTVLDPTAQINEFSRFEISDRLTPEKATAVRDHRQKLYVWGVAAFVDVFNVVHHSYFCFAYSGQIDTPAPDAPAQGIGKSASIDGTCEAPKSD